MSQPSAPDGYSKAFETLVQSDDDIVGLLAYSLFKASVRERVRTGQSVPRDLRTPTKAETNAYRGQAERILEEYANRAIEDAEPGIAARAQDDARSEIISTIRQRTGLWSNIVTGVVVWLVTIALTALVVFAAPDWVRSLVEHATPK